MAVGGLTAGSSKSPRDHAGECAGRPALRKRIQVARDAHGQANFQRNLDAEANLPRPVDRKEARQRKYLQGMLPSKAEARSLFLVSATAALERDKMLYFNPIPSNSTAADFPSTLRTNGTVVAALGRHELEARAWQAFVEAVKRNEEFANRNTTLNHKWRTFVDDVRFTSKTMRSEASGTEDLQPPLGPNSHDTRSVLVCATNVAEGRASMSRQPAHDREPHPRSMSAGSRCSTERPVCGQEVQPSELPSACGGVDALAHPEISPQPAARNGNDWSRPSTPYKIVSVDAQNKVRVINYVALELVAFADVDPAFQALTEALPQSVRLWEELASLVCPDNEKIESMPRNVLAAAFEDASRDKKARPAVRQVASQLADALRRHIQRFCSLASDRGHCDTSNDTLGLADRLTSTCVAPAAQQVNRQTSTRGGVSEAAQADIHSSRSVHNTPDEPALQPAASPPCVSRRYKGFAPHLTRGIAIRPSHGMAWDYMPGVYNRSLEAVDMDELKAQLDHKSAAQRPPTPQRHGTKRAGAASVDSPADSGEATSASGLWFDDWHGKTSRKPATKREPDNAFLNDILREKQRAPASIVDSIMGRGVQSRGMKLRHVFLQDVMSALPPMELAERRGHRPYCMHGRIEPRHLQFVIPAHQAPRHMQARLNDAAEKSQLIRSSAAALLARFSEARASIA